MSGLISLYRSTVGKKYVMAVTGIIGFGYVVLHMLGNLQVFLGPAQLNAYAHLLKASGLVLWTARSILLAAVILHIVSAYQLWRISARSRPIGYARWVPVGSDYASRTMRWTGPILLLFIIFHILDLTTGNVHPGFQESDVYQNVIASFRLWYVSGFYILAMLALSFHMYHGVWSMFQSLGVNHPKYNGFIRGFATVITLLVVIGFISIPVAVLTGIIS